MEEETKKVIVMKDSISLWIIKNILEISFVLFIIIFLIVFLAEIFLSGECNKITFVIGAIIVVCCLMVILPVCLYLANKYVNLGRSRFFWAKQVNGSWQIFNNCWKSNGPYIPIILPVVEYSKRDNSFQTYNLKVGYVFGHLKYIIPFKATVIFKNYHCFAEILSNRDLDKTYIDVEAEIKNAIQEIVDNFIKNNILPGLKEEDWASLPNSLDQKFRSQSESLYGNNIIFTVSFYRKVMVEIKC